MPRAAIAALLLCAAACQHSPPRPSVVIAVLDTTRADSVSAYGEVAGTTPTVDALAREGVLYEHAYANANWTVPSHASLFTGLLPNRHGLVSGNEKLTDAPTLAERLQALGYETLGISENPWLAMNNGINRGFGKFLLSDGNMAGMLQDWMRGRKGDRPFFLFLNVMDAHEPYTVRDTNPFLPAGAGADAARAVKQKPADYVCATKAHEADLAIVRGLYLGDVHAADAKLAGLLHAIAPLRAAGEVIVIVTSDHGEYLGEHWRLGHVIGVNDPVLHVPLVVHGLRGVAPARIQAPVQIADVLPSVLAWIGAPVPTDLAGEPLPTTEPSSPRNAPIISEYGDYFRLNKEMPDFLRSLKVNMDARCAPEQRMFGDMRAIIQFPRKAIWYSEYALQLFDLRDDPGEQRDLAESMPAAAAGMRSALEHAVARTGAAPRPATGQLSPEVLERLRALGYFDRDRQ